MSGPLENASPVGPVHGFPARDRNERSKRPDEREAHKRRQDRRDRVSVHDPATVARRLLRERVLARTREQLGLEPGEFVPRFAEAVDAEPVAAFVGRLIGAQNQLAALRVGVLAPDELRHRLDAALRAGVDEVLLLLVEDGRDGGGAEVVAEVLAEYGRRLAELVD